MAETSVRRTLSLPDDDDQETIVGYSNIHFLPLCSDFKVHNNTIHALKKIDQPYASFKGRKAKALSLEAFSMLIPLYHDSL